MKIRPPNDNGNEDGDEPPMDRPEPYLDAAKEALRPFLDANPLSSLKDVGSEVLIDRPWGDASLAINVPREFGDIAAALNKLMLPETFSALWHTDSRDLEIIYTAFPLSAKMRELIGRKFKFTLEGETYTCEFARSSSRLLALAKHTQPLTISPTDHRNLISFNLFTTEPDEAREGWEPFSFWIRKIEWNEEAVIHLATHLNFYMAYYDTISPLVLIHFKDSQKDAERKIEPLTRHREGTFPATIQASVLDENMMSLWNAALTGDTARRFLYYYRIIEYASFFYLEDTARQAVRRVLALPTALNDLGVTVEKLMAALSDSRMDDVARFNAVLRDCAEIGALWREMAKNMRAFSESVEFDGGFVLPPAIAPTLTGEQFAVGGHDIFGRAIRSIRNALTHGRDLKSAAIILPTRQNFRRLQPWVNAISIAAGDVVLYRNRS